MAIKSDNERKDIKRKTGNIAIVLEKWYLQNKRELPWRETTNPYRIWISEIILQQTRVAQGLDYYLRFIDRFPDVKALAEASEDEVLTCWQGLGYYSRARNLHTAAKAILEKFEGIFPQTHTEILALKGIGEYTAAAISSFAYNQPYAVLDGNVFRVLSRLFAVKEPVDSGSGKSTFARLARELLDVQNPGLYNQAIMEFGALQCVPSNPDCPNCPLQDRCQALETNTVRELPVKQGKTKVLNRFFNYLDIRHGNSLFLKKRTGNDIWKNLYELPLVETQSDIPLDELLMNENFARLIPDAHSAEIKAIPIEIKHILSHRIIYAKFYRISINHVSGSLKTEYTRISEQELPDFAISRLVSKYFEKRQNA